MIFIAFIAFLRDHFVQDYKKNANAHKQKYFFIQPEVVLKTVLETPGKYGTIHSPLFTYIIQKPNQFVATAIDAFQCGYNTGLIVNEAKNFDWCRWVKNKGFFRPGSTNKNKADQ